MIETETDREKQTEIQRERPANAYWDREVLEALVFIGKVGLWCAQPSI